MLEARTSRPEQQQQRQLVAASLLPSATSANSYGRLSTGGCLCRLGCYMLVCIVWLSRLMLLLHGPH